MRVRKTLGQFVKEKAAAGPTIRAVDVAGGYTLSRGAATRQKIQRAKKAATAVKTPAAPVTMRSGSSDWRTPAWLAEALKKKYGPFDLDPAAAPGTSLGRRSYTRHDGGREHAWKGRVYCNPPHARSLGETVGPWLEKGLDEISAGHCDLAVFLVPSRTDTVWWHELVLPRANEVLFVRGRLRFTGDGEGTAGAPFPSAVVVFRKRGPGPAGPRFQTIAAPKKDAGD